MSKSQMDLNNKPCSLGAQFANYFS